MNYAVALIIFTSFPQGECGGRIIHGVFFGTLNEDRLIEHQDPKNVSEFSITQPLDHFTPSDSRTWSQRYLKSADHYVQGGPVCIFVSGESKIDVTWLSVGLMVTQCSRIGAMLYGLEHRFFGKSKPLTDASVGSLRYLTSQQALADVASFISYIKVQDNLGKNPKIILYGGSYAGTLVTYFKQVYPTLATAVISSSGPIEWKYIFPEFAQLSGKVIKLQSSTCHATITLGIKEMQAKLRAAGCSSSVCPVDLSPLKICGKLDVRNSRDIQTLYGSISSLFSLYVQYNGIYKVGIKSICNFMDSLPSNKTNFEKLAETINRMNFHMENECLFISYVDFCRYMSPTDWTSYGVADGARMWLWLVCNEFASFQTTSSLSTHPFLMDTSSSFYASQCQCAFGKQFTENYIQSGVQKTLRIYGGAETIRSGVAFTSGDYDPWSAIGIINESSINPKDNTQQLILTIAGGSHCNDMQPSRASDSPSLLEARNRVFEFIKKATQI